jgi:hypothetical protein
MDRLHQKDPNVAPDTITCPEQAAGALLVQSSMEGDDIPVRPRH